MSSQGTLLEPLAPPSLDPPIGITWRFEVIGHPEPQGSFKPIISATTGRAMLKSSNETVLRRWRKLVAETARAKLPPWLAEPLDQPVYVSLIFVRERSPNDYLVDGHTLRKGAPRFPDTKPDVDKLERAMLDALTGVAFVNDSRVVSCVALKRFADLGEAERVIVEVTPL